MGKLEHWIGTQRHGHQGDGAKRPVTLHLGEFTLAGIEDLGRDREMSLDTLMGRAIRYYLQQRDARYGWHYPRFARNAARHGPEKQKELTVKLTRDLFQAAGREAKRQQVSIDRLLEHAALYYLADAARGHIHDPEH
jgi:hypothetical protein